MRKYWAATAVLCALQCIDQVSAGAAEFPTPLPVETTGQSAHLPESYSQDWVFLDYFFSPGVIDSKIDLIDTQAKAPADLKAQIGANYYGNFLQSTVRREVYVAETFFSRSTRGTRTDAITIYDTKTLAPTAEIILPGAKRGLFVPQLNSFQFADHEKLGLVFNFTPAASVTVVDLQARKVLHEVPIPGCSLVYPSGPRGFSSLCASGTMLSIQLTAAGKVASQTETKPFNNLDDDPLFSAPGVAGHINYFVSYKGRVQPIDLSGADPKLSSPWSLVTDEEAKANWRPSGLQLVAANEDGRLYVIMQSNGHEGSHMDGGNQVWVFDVTTHAKVATIDLKNQTQAIELSSGPQHRLLATTLTSTLDVYDTNTGHLISSSPTLSGGALALIYPVRR